MFSWSPSPTVYSIPEKRVVKEWALSAEWRPLKPELDASGDNTAILTEDLSCVIAVINAVDHDNEVDEGVNAEVMCYFVDENKVSTVSLKGLGDISIKDAKVVDGDLQWLVKRAYKSKYLIVDSSSQILHEITVPKKYSFRVPFWDVGRGVIWFAEADDRSPTSEDQMLLDLSVLKYDINSKTYMANEKRFDSKHHID